MTAQDETGQEEDSPLHQAKHIRLKRLAVRECAIS